MNNNRKNHRIITSNLKKQIEPLDIVLPSMYGKLYAKAANALKIDLNPDELLDSDMLNEKFIKHVVMLGACMEKAIIAIEREDKITLQDVLAETKVLRNEIEELHKIIYEDTLTKSHNRKWFEDTYLDTNEHSLLIAGTMVVIDLNKFKTINDTYGHVVGDKVLIHVATKLKETGGEVVRYGGDEFLVVFDDTKSSSTIAETIDSMLMGCAKKSFKVKEESFKVSFAYGLASFTAGSDLNTIIDSADKAMYRHKQVH